MKEIKFRIWTKVAGMLSDTEMDILRQQAESVKTLSEFFKQVQIGGNIIMQYTGIRDKNRKEVYEGDIVGFEVYNDSYVTVLDPDQDAKQRKNDYKKLDMEDDDSYWNYSNKYHIKESLRCALVIKYNEENMSYCLWEIPVNTQLFDEYEADWSEENIPDTFKVIGNIYQNPELLEGE